MISEPGTMIEITTVIEWDMAHRLGRGYKSKCKNLHGHRYRAEITLQADRLDSHGMILDFGIVKQICKGWIDDRIDHATLVDNHDSSLVTFLERQKQKYFVVEFSTTVECIVDWLAYMLQFQLNKQLGEDEAPTLTRLRVFETPNNWCDWSGFIGPKSKRLQVIKAEDKLNAQG